MTTARWLLPLSWILIRRRWMEQGGALLVTAGIVALLGFATRRAPTLFPEAASLYLTVALGIAMAVLVAAPLLINTETIFSSTRLALLPISPRRRAIARIPLGNPLRTMVAIVVLFWGMGTILFRAPGWESATAQTLQLVGLVSAGLAVSLAIEDAIRLRRAIVVQQAVFLTGVAGWPMVVQLVFEPGRFVPPPDWVHGPAGALLLAGRVAPIESLAVASGWFMLAAATLVIHRSLILGAESHPAPPPASAGWTAAVARLFAGMGDTGAEVSRELLIPLRFVFFRLCLVFIGLAALAALVTGQPFLLLSLAFWWLPLSTNLVGPDAPDGELRYALTGRPVTRVFRPRLIAMCILSATVFLLAAVVALVTGWGVPPVIGPPSPLTYLAAAVFAISLLPLWAIGGDRYSLRYSDPLEMRTLLPERRRSAGIVASLMLIGLWIATGIVAAVVAAVTFFVIHSLAPGPVGGAKLLGTAVLAASVHLALHRVHESRLSRHAGHAR